MAEIGTVELGPGVPSGKTTVNGCWAYGRDWGIENWLHRVRDVVFGETGSAPQRMTALRNLVTGILRRGGVKIIAAALCHYACRP